MDISKLNLLPESRYLPIDGTVAIESLCLYYAVGVIKTADNLVKREYDMLDRATGDSGSTGIST